MDDITAKIMIAVQAGDALRNIGEVRAALEQLTAARKKDEKASKAMFRKYRDIGESIREQRAMQEQLLATVSARKEDLVITKAISAARKEDLAVTKAINAALEKQPVIRPGEWRMATPLPHEQAAAEAAEKAAQKQRKIQEEIAASNRILQKQREELGNIDKFLKERDTLSVNELRIEQAAARLEVLKNKEQETARAFMLAEERLNKSQKRLFNAERNNEDPRRILALTNATRQYREEWLKAQQAAADAGLASRKAAEAYDKLTAPLGNVGAEARKTSRSMREFSASATAARAAGRLFGIDVGEGINPALIKQGIIVAGLASTVKVAGEVYSWFGEKARYASELAMMNYESVKEVADRNNRLWGAQQTALNSLEGLLQNERLSNVQKHQMLQLLKELQIDYRKFGFEIDSVTGKIKNFPKLRAGIEEYMTERQKEDIRRQKRELLKTREELTEEMDNAGVRLDNPWLNAIPAWWQVRAGAKIKDMITGGHTDRLGGGATIEKNQKKLAAVNKEFSALSEQSRQLENRDPIGKHIAATMDRAEALGNIITLENKQNQIQLQRIRGDEQGAAWLQRELELRKQIKELTIGELEYYRRIWDARQRITQLEQVKSLNTGFLEQLQIRDLMGQGRYKEAEWWKYRFGNLRNITDSDALTEARKNWENDYNSRVGFEHRERLKSLGKELEIENLLIAGDERRARLAKWQNELEKQGLKPEQLKAELAAREQLHQTQQFRHDWGALAERMRQTPMTRFRETAQSAVMADSLEAVRLQSRVTMQNPEMKILNEQLKILKDVKQVLSQMNQKGSTLTVWTP